MQGLFGQSEVPGVIVAHSPAETNIYIGSPSIVILHDGTYVAAYQKFGKELARLGKQEETFIATSNDRGKSWQEIAAMKPFSWANLFVYQTELYLMGTAGHYGPLVISKSLDGGKTWTKPIDKQQGLLRDEEEYHTAPVPILIHNGRIFRAMEDRNPREKWGVNFRSFVVSAPLDADLLKASSWTVSNRLRYNQDWPGRAWLEGNLVVSPEGEIWNILRNDIHPEGGKACIIKVSEYGETVTFDPENGFIDFPGGCKKFTIRYDGVSKRYWSLTNYIPEEFKGHNPERTRNTLALISSSDLRNWVVNKIVLQHPDVAHTGFQYADWQFEGNDIITLIRTAYPEPDGTKAHNCHDANYITFFRVENFRK
ncbi:MAG: hypothetical protein DHS20C18_25940 [Saprospiraceae bacterium]|nr:MAG: hypothetical protein DHS20C18_25940 [Saprospiraceae bacterium]